MFIKILPVTVKLQSNFFYSAVTLNINYVVHVCLVNVMKDCIFVKVHLKLMY